MNEITMKMQADQLIRMALQEDITSEVVSTNAVMPTATKGTVDLIAKEDGVIAGLDIYARVFTILDEKTEIDFYCKDGDEVKKGELLATLHSSVVNNFDELSQKMQNIILIGKDNVKKNKTILEII